MFKNPLSKNATPLINKQFAAVHVVSESADHYNLLVEHLSAKDIVDYIIDYLGDEFYHLSEWFITAENPNISDETSELICKTISDYWEE